MAEIREDIRSISTIITIVSEAINELTKVQSKESYDSSRSAITAIDSVVTAISQTKFYNNDERELVLNALKINLKPSLVKLSNYYVALRGDNLTQTVNTAQVDEAIHTVEAGRQRVRTPINVRLTA